MEFNCRVRVCDIVKLFFKYMINQPLFIMIQQLSLFYSHVHIKCLANSFILFKFFDRVVFSQMKLLSCFVIYQRFMPTRMIKVMITREFMFSI